MSAPVAPQPGDYGLVATYGNWRDRLVGWAIRYGTNSPVNHAFVYIGDGQIVEAQPGGAVISPVTKYDNITWSTGRGDMLAPAERIDIVTEAKGRLGTPYGWLDIVAIALAQRRLGATINNRAPLNMQPWWVRRVMSTRTLICSQLVDVAYEGANVHLFTDGRLPGLVSPGDLYTRLAR